MAKSIKYKEADTYHDAANVYDTTQGKTQEEINASMNPTDVVSFTEQGYTVSYCKSGNVATVVVNRDEHITDDVDVTFTKKLPFKPYLNETIAVSGYISNSGFLYLTVDGGLRVIHKKNVGWYKCIATFIAKDL